MCCTWVSMGDFPRYVWIWVGKSGNLWAVNITLTNCYWRCYSYDLVMLNWDIKHNHCRPKVNVLAANPQFLCLWCSPKGRKGCFAGTTWFPLSLWWRMSNLNASSAISSIPTQDFVFTRICTWDILPPMNLGTWAWCRFSMQPYMLLRKLASWLFSTTIRCASKMWSGAARFLNAQTCEKP